LSSKEIRLGESQFQVEEIADPWGRARHLQWLMPISARNKLRGKIEEIELGDIMAHVVVRVGDNLIESAITRRSADELKLKKGDTVTAVVEATEVMIQKD